MSAGWATLAFQVAQFVATLVIAIVVWHVKRETAHRSAIADLSDQISDAKDAQERRALEARISTGKLFNRMYTKLAERIEDLKKDVDRRTGELDSRMTRLESEIGHQLKREEIVRIHDRLDNQNARFAELQARTGEIEGATRQAGRLLHEMNEFLLGRGPHHRHHGDDDR